MEYLLKITKKIVGNQKEKHFSNDVFFMHKNIFLSINRIMQRFNEIAYIFKCALNHKRIMYYEANTYQIYFMKNSLLTSSKVKLRSVFDFILIYQVCPQTNAQCALERLASLKGDQGPACTLKS